MTNEDRKAEAKREILHYYFAAWRDDLGRAKVLLEGDYCLEGILILSCYIGALARLRYPTCSDRDRYRKVVMEYSGLSDTYEKVDLLLFYQWEKTDLAEDKKYKALTNYEKIKNTLVDTFGDEAGLKGEKQSNRYQPPDTVLEAVAAHPFKGLDKNNLKKKLPLFSLCEMLYVWVRCYAVHESYFPLWRRSRGPNGKTRYKAAHVIDGKLVYKTTSNIVENMETEYSEKGGFPPGFW